MDPVAIGLAGQTEHKDVVQRSEHPITLDESSANVESIQEKLSHEAFDGARTRLLTCKNVLLADVEGTRGKV